MADRTPGLLDVDTRLAEISAKGDGLEQLATLVDFELFRSTLEAAAPRKSSIPGRAATVRSFADVQSSDSAGNGFTFG